MSRNFGGHLNEIAIFYKENGENHFLPLFTLYSYYIYNMHRQLLGQRHGQLLGQYVKGTSIYEKID